MGSTILIADPSNESRAAFVAALAHTHFRIVGECVHGDALIDAVTRIKPWCVAVDLALPGPSERLGEAGVAAIRRITDEHHGLTVLVVHDQTNIQHVVSAMAAGGDASLRKPFRPEALIDTLDKLNNPKSESASSKMLAARVHRALPMTYKGVDEGFFSKRRDAVTAEIGLMGMLIHTEENLARGRVLNVEVSIAGEAPIKAKMQVAKTEPVPGMSRFAVQLTYVEMSPDERGRLQAYFKRLLEKGTSVMRK